MPGKLTAFQRTMLFWNSLHPYNAVCVARVRRPLDMDRLSAFVNRRLDTLGLTSLTIDPERNRFSYNGRSAQIPVRLVETSDPHASLESELEREINTPFAVDEKFTPFRFLAVAAGDSFYLVMVYCHFISDANPVTFLTTTIAKDYVEGTFSKNGSLDPYARAMPRLFGKMLKCLPWWVMAFPGTWAHAMRAAKPSYPEMAEQGNGLCLLTIGPEELARVIRLAHSWRVTLNDLFLAALLKAVTPIAAGRITGKRPEIAVSSIVSLRRDLPAGFSKKMGPFLGSFAVHCPLPERVGLEKIAANVHRQTVAAKKRRLYLRTPAHLAFALRFLKYYPAERREKFYRQNHPLWGGLTNLNLNPASRECPPAVAECFRAVSTGPICPLVLSTTTYNDALAVGASYDKRVLSRQAAEGIVGDFARHLKNPPEN